jgi:hypothetical protein
MTLWFISVVLYVCETWSLTLREEYRLKVFENRSLKRISGQNRNEKLQNAENGIERNLVTCALRKI